MLHIGPTVLNHVIQLNFFNRLAKTNCFYLTLALANNPFSAFANITVLDHKYSTDNTVFLF
jgi:hypothetical protein